MSNGVVLALAEPPELVGIGVSIHQKGETTYVKWPTDCLHLYRYHGQLILPNHEYRISPGTISVNEALSTFGHRWDEDQSNHIYVHFRCAPEGAGRRFAPHVQHLKPEEFDELWDDLVEATGWFQTQKTRARARVWDTLWQIVADVDVQTPRLHPALQRAVHLIETRLAQPLDLDLLSREAGLSHSQLIRLFRARFGTTIVEYVRQRRVERARRLLVHSTMPIKSIAHAVGIPDLQHFNKTVRRECGVSPTALRNSDG